VTQDYFVYILHKILLSDYYVLGWF